MKWNDPVLRALLNRFQGGFPITDHPFSNVAAQIGIGESALIRRLHTLLQRRVLTRFGPLYDAEAMGGRVVLAAMAVPEARFDEVAALLATLPEVAHNYARNHPLNMWFVAASDRPDAVHAVLDRIRDTTGLEVLAFPKRREFKVGLWVHLASDGTVDTVPVPRHARPPAFRAHPGLDALDRAIVQATQAGLPLEPAPYRVLADRIGCDAQELMQRLRRMWEGGIIRRIGAVPHHYRLGLRGNGMVVWDVPDERVDAAGARLAASPWVSHCYLRPRHGERWPYNLFTMLHGKDRDAVRRKVHVLARTPELRGAPYRILYSTRVLKKAGLRIAA
ncbi:MAG: Lrp/AsnC family transcriptional regulator [Gammaproteobacteria bacterium]|nr:MAG: Lrp/AsnC family transcriptional regulator [Gammaproteobacteria bacterium]